MAEKADIELKQQTAPFDSNGIENILPTSECKKRIRKDYKALIEENLQGIYCVPDEEIVTKYHALIIGAFDTPYEGGFFLFTIIFPSNYPNEAPFVKYQLTDGGTVRINPNLYRNGKVCLSTLGTRAGQNEWSPTQTLTSVLLSIQSILNEKPFFNVPVAASQSHNSEPYNNYVRHEVLRVNVCDLLSSPPPPSILPVALARVIQTLFPTFVEYYENICRINLFRDGQPLLFTHNFGKYRYSAILERLQSLKSQLLVDEGSGDVV